MTEIIPVTRAGTNGTANGLPALELTAEAPRQVYVLFTDLDETLRAVRVADPVESLATDARRRGLCRRVRE
jgi:hypothetical protein